MIEGKTLRKCGFSPSALAGFLLLSGPGNGLKILAFESRQSRRLIYQCAIKTGKVAFARMWRVAPPNIICRSRLWVKAPFTNRSQPSAAA